MGTSNNLEMHEATPSIENTPTTNEPKVPMLNPYDDVYVPSKTDEVPGKTTAGNNSPYEIPPSEYENVALNKNVYGNTAIPTNRLKEIYTAMMQQDSTTLEDEFSAIKAAANAMEAPKTAATSNESKKLNRYKNILPYDSSRVVLEPNDTKDFPPNGYINASYIDSYNQPKFFIATQGPLDKTIGHFWTMIWQKKCHVIVMLAKLSENGKRKCSKYWPDEKATMNVGSFEIVAKEVTCYGCYVARKLELALKGSKESSLTVTQYQYTVWPDHGVPVTTTGLVRLHSAVLRKADAFPPAPIVVHCSAGAGRTGTLIGIDYLMREMKEKSSVDVYSAVMNMRRQRCDMVQTLNQYRFLHKVITESYELGDTDFFANDLAEKIHGQELNSYQEFHNLNMILPLNTSRDFGSKSAYAEKNRVKEKTLIPYDRSRVTMTKGGFDKTTPYINASFIQEYICCGTLIATQGPMSNTVNEFWRCIVDQNVNMIVMLTQLQEDNKEMCFPYWPEEIDSIQQFGRINVKLTSITEESKYIIRNFDVTWKNITTNVAQFHFSQWAEKEAEPNKDDLISILNDVISFRNQTPQGCMMVHCSDGLGRSGVFCAMINLIERLNAEHRIDVFRTVKDLRDMRPGMVSSLDQYKLCYSSLVQYLSSFDLYSNFNA